MNEQNQIPHREKFDRLFGRLQELGSVVVAYSGGVDSSLLMKAGTLALSERCLGVVARSETLTDFEFEAAMAVARDHQFRVRVIRYSELDIDQYASNTPERCYFCKKDLLGRLKAIAQEVGAQAILEGSNADDVSDWRPGLRAVEELGVVSPLREAGLTKQEIRDLARALKLPNWGKPSAPCLASRIAYGIPIDRTNLDQVAAGERLLRAKGFEQVRLRHHGDLARIEVGADEVERLFDRALREDVAAQLRQLGFRFVTLDLEGYRMGSLNAVLATASAQS